MTPEEIVALVLRYEDRFIRAAAGNMAALWTLGLDVRRAISKEFWLGIIVGVVISNDASVEDGVSEFTMAEVLMRLDERIPVWNTRVTYSFIRLLAEIQDNSGNPPFDPRNN